MKTFSLATVILYVLIFGVLIGATAGLFKWLWALSWLAILLVFYKGFIEVAPLPSVKSYWISGLVLVILFSAIFLAKNFGAESLYMFIGNLLFVGFGVVLSYAWAHQARKM
jgi:hypothetical protein